MARFEEIIALENEVQAEAVEDALTNQGIHLGPAIITIRRWMAFYWVPMI